MKKQEPITNVYLVENYMSQNDIQDISMEQIGIHLSDGELEQVRNFFMDSPIWSDVFEVVIDGVYEAKGIDRERKYFTDTPL